MPVQIFSSPCRPTVQTHLVTMLDMWYTYFLSPLSPERAYPMFTNYCCPRDHSKEMIFYNIEQLTDPTQLKKAVAAASRPTIRAVWDYSATNVDLFKEHGVDAVHVPMQVLPEYAVKLRRWIPKVPKYDFGFCGHMTPRRKAIIQQMRAKGLNLLCIGNVWQDARDQQLAQCRYILNIHQGDTYKIFEVFRCLPWLEVGVGVISEESFDMDPRCISTSYDNFVETCQSLIQKPSLS